MWQADSTLVEGAEVEQATPQVTSHRKPQHPDEVLRLLPKDATPEQQDSAIQANFQPGEIHYSSRPDTLHLPGHDPGKSPLDVSLPLYYKESFFSGDSLFHPELPGGRYGVAGDPVPYTLRGDDVLSTLLLFCFVAGVLAVANSKTFISKQAKNFFRTPHSESTTMTETSTEVRFQLFLVMQTALLLSLFQYFYTQDFIGDTFTLASQYQLIAVFLGVWLGYFVLKALLYTWVNSVFFGLRRNLQWLKSMLFVTAMEGVAMLPAALLQVYFNMPIENVMAYYIAVVGLAKILTLYKGFLTFFKGLGGFVQIILYFCTLEMIPLAAVWGVLVMIGNILKINY